MRHRTHRASLLVAGLCLALAFALAACGSGGKASNGPDPATVAAIRHSIAVGFTSTDPAICVQNATPNLIENIYGGSVARCKREQPRSHPAKSVAVSDVSVSGNTAHARAAPHGGDNDGQQFRLTLMKIGPDWKIDDLRYIYGSDPKSDQQVDLELRRIGGGAHTPMGRAELRCAQTRLRSAFQSGGVPFGKQELLAETKAVLVGCLRSNPSLASGYRRLFFRGLERQGRRAVGASAAKCVITRLRRVTSDQDIIDFITGGPTTSWLQKAKAIARHCGSIQAILRGFDNFQQT